MTMTENILCFNELVRKNMKLANIIYESNKLNEENTELLLQVFNDIEIIKCFSVDHKEHFQNNMEKYIEELQNIYEDLDYVCCQYGIRYE